MLIYRDVKAFDGQTLTHAMDTLTSVERPSTRNLCEYSVKTNSDVTCSLTNHNNKR